MNILISFNPYLLPEGVESLISKSKRSGGDMSSSAIYIY